MRKRGAEAATTQTGRMGAEAPVGISGRTPQVLVEGRRVDHWLMRVTIEQFEAAVQSAVDSIPDEFKPYLENTVFVIEESSPDNLMGLYEGSTALAAGEGLPERITLYKRSHERAAESLDELIDEVRRTILHEVGHHFGMEEEDLPY